MAAHGKSCEKWHHFIDKGIKDRAWYIILLQQVMEYLRFPLIESINCKWMKPHLRRIHSCPKITETVAKEELVADRKIWSIWHICFIWAGKSSCHYREWKLSLAGSLVCWERSRERTPLQLNWTGSVYDRNNHLIIVAIVSILGS